MIENTKKDSDEIIFSLDVKNLYFIVPLKNAIDIALKKLYSQNEGPDLSRSTMKRLSYMDVSNVFFKCNNSWYVQEDGLVMGASPAVTLAHLWLKDYKKVLAMDMPQKIDMLEDMKEKRPKMQ